MSQHGPHPLPGLRHRAPGQLPPLPLPRLRGRHDPGKLRPLQPPHQDGRQQALLDSLRRGAAAQLLHIPGHRGHRGQGEDEDTLQEVLQSQQFDIPLPVRHRSSRHR